MFQATWPDSTESLAFDLKREGFTREGKGRWTLEVKGDGKTTVIGSPESGALIITYEPDHDIEFVPEVLGMLRGVSSGVTFSGPNELQLECKDAYGNTTTTTTIGVRMPRGIWKYTSSMIRRVNRKR